MSSGALQKYTNRIEFGSGEPKEVDQDESEDLGAFGWLRGGNHVRALMLDLRKRDGSRLAIGYSWISSIAFDPSVGITITTTDRRVTITGQNLNAEVRPGVRLYEGLLRQRVLWIHEANHTVSAVPNAADCLVTEISK